MFGELGVSEILLIIFIVVIIFGTSRIPEIFKATVQRDDALVEAIHRRMPVAAFGLLTAVLFGLGFWTGEEVAVMARMRVSMSVVVFAVVALVCLAISALPVMKLRVPLTAVRLAPVLFLVAGLATGIVAAKALGANPQVTGLR